MDVSRRGLAVAAAALLAAGKANAQQAAAPAAPAAPFPPDPTVMHVPALDIPVPHSVSAQAQAYLGNVARRLNAQQSGAPAAAPAAQGGAAAGLLRYAEAVAQGFQGQTETIDLGNDAKLYRIVPTGLSGRRARVAYMDIHGGGFTSGGGDFCRLLATGRAKDYGVTIYAVDYRLAPEHQYPAGLDDCVAAYRQVLRRHRTADLIVGGASAGGNLAAALMLRARAEHLPFPCGLILATPAADMTGVGDSHQTNKYWGGVSQDGLERYFGDADPSIPFLSPVYGDLEGFPPTILSTGTRDLLLSDTVRMHAALRRTNVKADLLVQEAGPHGNFQGSAPEDAELLQEFKRFMFGLWHLPL